jgi:triacylglycerol lipase
VLVERLSLLAIVPTLVVGAMTLLGDEVDGVLVDGAGAPDAAEGSDPSVTPASGGLTGDPTEPEAWREPDRRPSTVIDPGAAERTNGIGGDEASSGSSSSSEGCNWWCKTKRVGSSLRDGASEVASSVGDWVLDRGRDLRSLWDAGWGFAADVRDWARLVHREVSQRVLEWWGSKPVVGPIAEWLEAWLWDEGLAPLGPDPEGEPTAYPIIFVHGFASSPTNIWRFRGVTEALEADGHVVVAAETAPFGSVDARARQLAEQIDAVLAETGAEKVNLIAHSMGGLDSRYVVSELGYGDRVASVTTVASPHHGTPVADTALGLLPDNRHANRALNALLRLAGSSFSNASDEADLRAALSDISTDGASELNERLLDDPRVYYQSWSAVSDPLGRYVEEAYDGCEGQVMMHPGHADGLTVLLQPLSLVFDEPHDGMSTVESAKWGRFRGCIPADHLDQTGYESARGPSEQTGFDHRRFFRNMAFELSTLGH